MARNIHTEANIAISIYIYISATEQSKKELIRDFFPISRGELLAVWWDTCASTVIHSSRALDEGESERVSERGGETITENDDAANTAMHSQFIHVFFCVCVRQGHAQAHFHNAIWLLSMIGALKRSISMVPPSHCYRSIRIRTERTNFPKNIFDGIVWFYSFCRIPVPPLVLAVHRWLGGWAAMGNYMMLVWRGDA